MKHALMRSGLLLAFFFVSSGAGAAVDTQLKSETSMSSHSADDSFANIHTGNWNIDGSMDFSKTEGARYDDTQFTTGLMVKYFLVNRFALGVSGGLDASEREDLSAAVGPAASFYFWNDGKFAANVDAGVRFGLTEFSYQSVIDSQVGVKYFVAPTVALGPSVFFRHYTTEFRTHQRYGVSMSLGIYL